MAQYRRISEIAEAILFTGTDAQIADISTDYQDGASVKAQVPATKTVVTTEVTHVATANGNLIVLDGGLDSTIVTIALVTTDTIEDIVDKIAAETYANMDVTVVDGKLVFTAAEVGNLLGFPGLYAGPAGLAWTNEIVQGTFLDGSKKEQLFQTLSGTVGAGTIKMYFNDEETPVELAVVGTEGIDEIIVGMVALFPAGYSDNQLVGGSNALFIGRDDITVKTGALHVDYGTTGLVAADYEGYRWVDVRPETGSAIFSFTNEKQQSMNAYVDNYIATIYSTDDPQSDLELQRTEVWTKTKWEKYFILVV